MWVFLMTEVMFLGALFVVYFYDHRLYPEAFASAGARTDLALGAGNTAVLLVSSLTMALAVRAAKEGRARALFARLLRDRGLGVRVPVLERRRVRAPHPGASPAGGVVRLRAVVAGAARGAFLLLVLRDDGPPRAAHARRPLAWLSGLAVRVRRRRGGPVDHFTFVEVAGLYWHFVDLVDLPIPHVLIDQGRDERARGRGGPLSRRGGAARPAGADRGPGLRRSRPARTSPQLWRSRP